jgi:hypothetical protein
MSRGWALLTNTRATDTGATERPVVRPDAAVDRATDAEGRTGNSRPSPAKAQGAGAAAEPSEPGGAT